MATESNENHSGRELLGNIAEPAPPSNSRRSQFWRSLSELTQSPRYLEFLHDEFPRDLEKEERGISRRDALKLMAASAAFAGLTGCTKLPAQKIVPYVRAPEEIVPGKPLFYATAMTLGGTALGLLVESHMGRPTKVEGNPEHPSSLGATDVFAQAAVLTLYDPDRSQVVLHEGRIADWELFLEALRKERDALRSMNGEGLRILTETVTSPSLGAQIRTLLAEFPAATWHQYEPFSRDAAREGARLAFGEYVNAVYRVDRADVILSLDADFLCAGTGSVRYAREFTARRDVESTGGTMNRLYVVESTPSNTGAMADHRLPTRSAEVEAFARELAGRLGLSERAGRRGSWPEGWMAALARDLERHRGRSLIVAGDQQPPAVHALAHALNEALGNFGTTVVFTAPLEVQPVHETASLRQLVTDMQGGRVKTLLILGGNPVYTAPAEFKFANTLQQVPLRVHLSLYEDETSEQCHWHVPETHFLETWSDARAHDGTITILQPLIAPLYNGKSAHELLAAFLGPVLPAHDVVKSYWKEQRGKGIGDAADFEAFWETSLHDGVVVGSALLENKVSVSKTVLASLPGSGTEPDHTNGALEMVFRPDPTIWDGRFANNGWLQELPKPLSQLTWDNAALLSPNTAQKLGVGNEDVLLLQRMDRPQVAAPVWIMPGHADASVTVYCGYGRTRAGRIGSDIGFNAFALRSAESPWFTSDLKVQRAGQRYLLATTQFHHSISPGDRSADEPSVAAFERELMRVATLDEFKKNPNFAQDPPEETTNALSLYPGYAYNGYAWGMVVDLNRCTGCNACVVACQAENNIPVVGKHEVEAGREMHWIRVDTYFRGDLENPETYHEPVLCMHCENAPCELVCPVGATTHSPEGLNEMTYNRCVGTRYCSNNCPYKVRRFNFLLYSDWNSASLKLLRNPNVSVRSRGVMEKCTYCVQRINAAKIESEKEERAIRDAEILTACQQACPTEALIFGNINDPASRVSHLRGRSRHFGLLRQLNTRPRTTYLAKLHNLNPEIPHPEARDGG